MISILFEFHVQSQVIFMIPPFWNCFRAFCTLSSFFVLGLIF